MSTTAPQSTDTGVKPTILAFHGSGSNATVHTIQMARLSRLLKPHFDIVSLEAPFISPAGPGVLPFFEGCGPFYRWIQNPNFPNQKLTIAAMRAGQGTSPMSTEVESLLRTTVTSITSRGGRVIGLLGFSQGTRIVAGLLKGAEIRREKGTVGDGLEWLDFAFAVSVCGSYPPLVVPESALKVLGADEEEAVLKKKIEVPTLHVQGNQDEWQWAGKLLIEGSYEVAEGKSKVVQVDMGHHYPVKAEDSEMIRDWVLSTQGMTGA